MKENNCQNMWWKFVPWNIHCHTCAKSIRNWRQKVVFAFGIQVRVDRPTAWQHKDRLKWKEKRWNERNLKYKKLQELKRRSKSDCNLTHFVPIIRLTWFQQKRSWLLPKSIIHMTWHISVFIRVSKFTRTSFHGQLVSIRRQFIELQFNKLNVQFEGCTLQSIFF